MLRFVEQHARIVSLVVGSVAVSAWTLVRFFDRPPTFDLFGQQVVAHQWLTNSVHGGAIIGPTNYILKMLFFYMPIDGLQVAWYLKLLAVTLVINVATYVLLLILLERLWREFYPALDKRLYLALAWLASIAGSVYWIQFSNSRNLEVVGGVFLICGGLRILHSPSPITYAAFGLLASVLFFADSLQIYMSLLPFLIFISFRWLVRGHKRKELRDILKLAGASSIGVAGAQLLFWLASKIWGVSFIEASSKLSTDSALSMWSHGASTAGRQLARLYIGGTELGKPIIVLNLLFVVTIVMMTAWCAWRRRIPRSLVALVATVWAVDIVVYVVSGQAAQSGTSRYLIMTAPFFVLLIPGVLHSPGKLKFALHALTIAVVTANSLALTHALVRNWNAPLRQYHHQQVAISYMQQHGYQYGYASMDSAIPVDYIANGKTTLLPVECLPDSHLRARYLFFDQLYYSHVQRGTAMLVPFILDGESITNYPAICDKAHLQAALGPWMRTDRMADGSEVLVYSAPQLKQRLE